MTIDALAALLLEADAAYEHAYCENMACTSTTVEPLPRKSIWKARWLHKRGVMILGEPSNAAKKAAIKTFHDVWQYEAPAELIDAVLVTVAAAYRAEREVTHE